MEYKLVITEFFEALENEDENAAKMLCGGVQHELKILDKISDLNASAKPLIKKVEQLKENVSNGRIHLARAKWRSIKAGFNGQLKDKLQEVLRERKDVELLSSSNKENRTQSSHDMSQNNDKRNYTNTQQRQQQYGQHGNAPQRKPDPHKDNIPSNYHDSVKTHTEGEEMYSGTNKTVPTHTSDSEAALVERRTKQPFQGKDKFGNDQKSKRASQAMRQNNPDIADLSDTNRPTKIAERFSELYDNEWTEAFEALSNLKSKQLKESEIIKILLEIVEQAYQFCSVEADSQITSLEAAMTDIMTGEKARSTTQPIRDEEDAMRRNLLVQYRKKLAAESVERLSEKFVGKHISLIIEKKSLGTPKPEGLAAKYTKKAVELAWWMCVQDPPVYMCPTKGSFNPNIYRSYTKSGTVVDFVVWPALKLYKDGGVLLKGVVQYK